MTYKSQYLILLKPGSIFHTTLPNLVDVEVSNSGNSTIYLDLSNLAHNQAQLDEYLHFIYNDHGQGD